MIEAPLPFDFETALVREGTGWSGDERQFGLRLAGAAWAYGCEFRPSKAEEGACTLELQIRVEAGYLAVGVLSGQGRYFVDEATIAETEAWEAVSLQIPAFSRRGPLIFRNAGTQPCRARVRVVRSRKLDVPQTSDTIDEFLAAGEALLAEARRPDAALNPGGLSAVAALTGAIAPHAGVALAQPDDRGFPEWLAGLDDKQLVALANAQLRPASADFFPDWCFDWAVRNVDFQSQLSTAVWRAMRDRCPEALLDIPWLEGTHVRMPLGSDLSLPLFTMGRFEPNSFALLRPMLRRGDVFVDVGANEGLYSVMAAAAVGNKGRVVAVEPSPRELSRLRANLESNGLADRTIVIDQALGSEAGWAELAVAEDAHSGQNAFADRIATNIAAAEVRLASVMTLDILARRLGDRRIDFVKIDVEGAELDVLRGGIGVLERHRPIWIVEVGRGDGPTESAVPRLFREAGYELFAIDDRLGGARRIEGEQWDDVYNLVAITRERMTDRWPAAARL